MKRVCAVSTVVILGAASLSAFATNHYWNSPDGSWFDSANWGGLEPPAASESAFAQNATNEFIRLNGGDAVCIGFQVGYGSTVDNTGGIWGTARIVGPGTLSINEASGALQAMYGRRLVLDNVTVQHPRTIRGYGELYFVNGSAVDFSATDGMQAITGKEGGKIVVDNSTVKVWSMGFGGDEPTELVIRNGGFFSHERDWNSTRGFFRVRLLDGTFMTSPSSGAGNVCYNASYLPRWPEGTYVNRATGSAFTPTLAGGEMIRWGGTLCATNGTSSQVTITSDATIYGGGRYVGGLFYIGNAARVEVGLSEIVLGANFGAVYGNKGCVYEYPNDITLGSWRNWNHVSTKTTNIVHGVLTIDTRDPFSEATYTAKMDNAAVLFEDGSGLAATGGGTVSAPVTTMPSKFTVLEVGEGTDFVNTGLPGSARVWLRCNELKVGAGASVKTCDSKYDRIAVVGPISLDSTATFNMTLGEPSKSYIESVISSVEDCGDVMPKFVFSTPLTEGWGVCRVGGSFFLTNAVCTADTFAAMDWRGRTDGLWSTAYNWHGQKVPGEGAVVRLKNWKGSAQMVTSETTNDLVNLSIGAIRAVEEACPFIIRGNPIRLENADAVTSTSKFPLITEALLTADGDVVNLKAGTTSEDASVIALKGGLEAPNARLTVSGEIVLGGEVNVKDLSILPIDKSSNIFSSSAAGRLYARRETALNVRAGGTVNVSAQESAQAVTGSVWIAKTGALNVTGDWIWNVQPNVHMIDGDFTVSGRLGGDAVQTYLGKGRLAVGGSTQTVRIGRGLTLEMSAWQDARIEVLSDATLASSCDLTLAPSAGIAVKPGAKLGFAPAAGATLTLAKAVDSVDYDLEVKGTGTTVLSVPCGAVERATVKAGATLAWTKPQTFAKLTVEPGATLAFGSDAGALQTIACGYTVDLTGVEIHAADEAAFAAATKRRAAPILTVPPECGILGVEEGREGDYSFAVIEAADGTVQLRAKAHQGSVIIVR